MAAGQRARVPPRRARRATASGSSPATTTSSPPTATRRSFSSAQERGGVVTLEGPVAPIEGQEMAGEMMLFMDPPRHTRYRKLVNRGFTPRMIAALEEHLRDLTVAHRRRRHGQGRLRLRRRRGRRAAARGHRRAARRAQRGPLQAVRLVEPHDRRRRPRVPGRRRRGHGSPGRDVHVRAGAGREAARRPAARHRDHAAERRGRRRLADRDGLQPVLHAAVGGRERDDPQRHRPRHERLPRPPRPVGAAGVRPRSATSAARSRRSCAGRRP